MAMEMVMAMAKAEMKKLGHSLLSKKLGHREGKEVALFLFLYVYQTVESILFLYTHSLHFHSLSQFHSLRFPRTKQPLSIYYAINNLYVRSTHVLIPRYDGRSGTFAIGDDHFPASLLDLPCILESYKTYDDSVLIKTADVGQVMIMVRDEGDPAPDVVEYRHGLTPPMRDARRRRFRREPDLNPELVRRVEKDLLNIMNGGTAENFDTEMVEQEEVGEESARNARKKTAPPPAAKPGASEAGTNAGEPERSDTDDSDDSM